MKGDSSYTRKPNDKVTLAEVQVLITAAVTEPVTAAKALAKLAVLTSIVALVIAGVALSVVAFR